MRKHTTLVLLVIFSIAVCGCTITHKYGPYAGKVVDAETGEPIEGAVVLIGFYTKGFSLGGTAYSFADAIETLTDAKGEFQVPPKRVTLFRTMSSWDEECMISIFKPGYGAYPGHSKTYSVPKIAQPHNIPENKNITFHLPKLLTLEERKQNLLNTSKPSGITNEKMKLFRKLESQERLNVGLKPYSEKIWR